MTAPLAQQASARSGPPIRVVSLCGSIKPLFSGTDDFHDNLVAVLRTRDMDVRPVDLGQWGLAQVPALLRKVAAEQPDLILMQYPTDAFSMALGPHVFSALQRLAPLVVTLHEFAAANPVRRASLSVLLARAAAVIATSEAERTSLLSWYPWLKTRSQVIPIGANFPARDWQPREPPFVVYFGQIRPEKGLRISSPARQPWRPAFRRSTSLSSAPACRNLTPITKQYLPRQVVRAFACLARCRRMRSPTACGRPRLPCCRTRPGQACGGAAC